ncbi:MAG: sugar transferase [Rhodospirillales bacterium]|nr:sugar transferase [Rhodospirillales bacterium]
MSAALYPVGKRLIDALGAAFALVLFGPIALLFGAFIRQQSPGPLFFVQTREGQCGRPFNILKLRTMYPDAGERLRRHLETDASAAAEFAANGCLRDDPRIVGRAGALARRYSIDEIPQLWNVLVGEMSLVGPRPLHPRDAEMFFDAPTRAARLLVLPGMTGLWQVRREGKRDVMRNIGELDLIYVRKRSLRFDFMILLLTPRAVLSGGGVS